MLNMLAATSRYVQYVIVAMLFVAGLTPQLSWAGAVGGAPVHTTATTTTTSNSAKSVALSTPTVVEDYTGAGITGAPTISVAPTHGIAVVSGLTVVYTPAAGYLGPDSVQVQSVSTSDQVIQIGDVILGTNTNTNTNTDTVAITVGARLDPSLDREVIGLINAQVAAAWRLADGQTNNVAARLERLHESGTVGTGRDVGDSATDPHAWVAGLSSFGTMNTPVSARYFTSGFTAGIDTRIRGIADAGIAFGYGQDRSKIGAMGTNNDATNVSLTTYATAQPLAGLFVDGILGYGRLSMDSSRWSMMDATVITGNRTGSAAFGSIVVSTALRTGNIHVAPYFRAKFVSAELNQFSEQGTVTSALTYNDMRVNSSAMTPGVLASYAEFPTPIGRISPSLRLEYQRLHSNSANQGLFYSDLGAGNSYSLTLPSNSQNTLLGTVGLRDRVAQNITVDLEYGVAAAASSAGHTLRALAVFGF